MNIRYRIRTYGKPQDDGLPYTYPQDGTYTCMCRRSNISATSHAGLNNSGIQIIYFQQGRGQVPQRIVFEVCIFLARRIAVCSSGTEFDQLNHDDLQCGLSLYRSFVI